MPPVITSLAPETETEAVNLMLRQIGEQPVADASTSTLADVVMALAILKETTRVVEAQGWKFNLEFALRVNPTGSSPFAWTNEDGSTTSINVFKKPSDAIRVSVAKTVAQVQDALDIVERRSKQYEEASSSVMVLYDRARNRDGLPASQYSFIFLDVVTYVDYEDLPQEMRRYIAIKAARVFAGNVPGRGSAVQLTETDEAEAFQTAKEFHGQEDEFNIFNNQQLQRQIGYPYRQGFTAGVVDTRDNK